MGTTWPWDTSIGRCQGVCRGAVQCKRRVKPLDRLCKLHQHQTVPDFPALAVADTPATFEDTGLYPRPQVTVTEGTSEESADGLAEGDISVDHDGVTENEALGLLLRGVAHLLGLTEDEDDA